MNRRENVFANLDGAILVLYFLLMLMGWANIYSAALDPDHPNIFDQSREYGKQFVWILVSTVIGIGILFIRGQLFRDFAFGIYGGVVVLLIAVLLFGKEVNGAKSWFGIGSFGIQPSEFAKFGTALGLSHYLSGLKMLTGLRSRLIAGAIVILPPLLILLQPDTGTALVFGAFVLVLYREGLSGNVLLLGIMAAIFSVLALILKEKGIGFPFTDAELPGQYFLMILLLIFGGISWWGVKTFSLKRYRKRFFGLIIFGVVGSIAFISSVDYLVDNALADHHKTRINILLGIEEDPQGYGYNVKQSETAIGSGGFSGKGYLDGTLTKYKYVPMQSTDFIFCTVGEEWGFIGTTVVIILFVLLILRIIQLSDRQRSKFTRIYAYCVASIFFFHLTINVGMTIGLAPVIGIPLPFFSYGGSSLIGFTVLLAILLRLDAQRLGELR